MGIKSGAGVFTILALLSVVLLLKPPAFAAPADHATIAGAAHSGVVNPGFTYPDFRLWDRNNWTGITPKTAPLVAWIETHQKDTRAEYHIDAKYRAISDFTGNHDYTWKSDNITDQKIVAPLQRIGLEVEIQEGDGGVQVYVVPKKVLADPNHRVPMLYVPYVLDKKDVFWAMNTLVHFEKYNQLCAQQGNFIIVYVVMDKSMIGKVPLFGSVDMAVDAFRGDYQRLYLNASAFAGSGAKIADVPGLDWSDENGHKRNPDAEIDHFGFILALNVTGMWTAKPTPGIFIANLHPANLRFDNQRVVHGILGQEIIAGASFVADHGKDHDPALLAAFDRVGLTVGQNEYQGRRWLIFSPRQAIADHKPLPLVVLLEDAHPWDDDAISNAYAEYRNYFMPAAEGDLNILVFCGETPAAIDDGYPIVKAAEKTYPIDPSRVYVTGHSHYGHLAREFAYRHPDMVAAVAPLERFQPGWICGTALKPL